MIINNVMNIRIQKDRTASKKCMKIKHYFTEILRVNYHLENVQNKKIVTKLYTMS